MATPLIEGVPITLDRPRHIIIDLAAYCLAEELSGKNFMDPATWTKVSFRDVRALLLAALRRDDPRVTLEQVGSWVNPGNLTEVTSKLFEAFGVSMPEATPEAERPLDVPAIPRYEEPELAVPTS